MSKKFICAVVFTMFMVFGLAACGGNVNESGMDSKLIQIVEEANKDLPMMIDEETKLEQIIVLPGNKVQFNHVLINASNEAIDVDEFASAMGPAIFNNVKANPGLETFRKKNVTFIYHYSDRDGEEIAVFEITPEDYK
ncbi:MAG: hypothetical protein FWG57_06015 [Endomicrobia bacterium]|nr:hypothetical protein [Endomicrobiia bacterium]